MLKQVGHERDGIGQRPLDDVSNPAGQPALATIGATLEGKTMPWQNPHQNPHPPHTLAWASWIRAGLGGWNRYGSKPGSIILHRGLLQLRAMLCAWHTKQHVCVA